MSWQFNNPEIGQASRMEVEWLSETCNNCKLVSEARIFNPYKEQSRQNK